MRQGSTSDIQQTPVRESQYWSTSNCSSVLFSMTKPSLPTDLMLLGISTCLPVFCRDLFLRGCCQTSVVIWYQLQAVAGFWQVVRTEASQGTWLKEDASSGHLPTASAGSASFIIPISQVILRTVLTLLLHCVFKALFYILFFYHVFLPPHLFRLSPLTCQMLALLCVHIQRLYKQKRKFCR